MNEEHPYPTPPSTEREKRRSNSQKVKDILRYMADKCNHFSLRKFLEVLFSSEDGALRKSANMFLTSGHACGVLDEWAKKIPKEEMEEWVMENAVKICQREMSFLTDRASRGPFKQDADFLHVPAAQISVSLLENFKLDDLTSRYARVTPQFQRLLTGIIGKEDEGERDTAGPEVGASRVLRDTSPGRTMITSMVLNLRSRQANYHGIINGFILWDNRVHKCVHQVLNHYGISSSYPFLLKGLQALSHDILQLARKAAADETTVKALLYDNFNWVKPTREASADHGNIVHDEVSAILLVLPHGDIPAAHITNRARFSAMSGNRHKIPSERALRDITPTLDDHLQLRSNTILHIKRILSEDVKAFKHFYSSLPDFEDPDCIIPAITEEYCLPTFDQEQGSTRGNMIVLRHYFIEVLGLPVSIFERVMFFIIGDRLTTVRDRVAQDQRAVDRSPHSIDRLTPFTMTNGLMHSCLNYIDNIGRNAWGGDSVSDPVSLVTLRDKLPNRSGLNPKKIDYYAWLRFYDVILRALVKKAAMTVLGLTGTPESDWATHSIDSLESFSILCASISDRFLIPSVDRLEALGIKKIAGNSNSGHALLLMRDLMLLREMRHAIKHGHPTRIHRVIRFWMPMFYAGGSFNYANEFMELLHNMKHDWPQGGAGI